ncbi:HET-domain-containing protein [Ophiobolus disseminans]|uniref:HET-domain-containing protein n=1 Tax=Ophiobolus disseminans TaxID=1469910 RepID=A0A6A7A7Q3_9PLEO|nr:HET-domain-containing protein [Ophiobolus disseminans]
MIRWLIEQLYGLAEALAAAHGATCRHGDLKPANILWFREAASAFGTLKIGDWGEAKIHKEVTSLRHGFTTAGYGTRRYEPPETGSHSPKLGQGLPKRSRLYDIWGFGCIIFECIIWCLYDSEQLKRFNRSLRQILHSQRGDPYWSRFQNSRPPPVGSDRSSRFLVPSGPHLSTSTNLRTPTTPTTDYEHPALNPEDWNFELDNPFAARVLSRSANLTGTPVHHSMSTSKLCANCEHFGERLRDSRFSISYATQTLRRNAAAGSCHLCSLLWQAYCENAPSESKEVQFYRANSTLHMSGTNRPVLTLLRNNGPDSRAHGIQIGYHKLPDVGSDLHFGLIQEWLNDCDSTHVECKASTRTKQTRSADVRLPTRLICVGNDEDEFVRLQETRSGDEGHWIALSYRWGDSPPFSTTRQNLSSHIEGMKLTTLPRTFQDAIRVTRGLRQKYLWIDSICIVQGKDGDFSDESKRMEDVYSGAYCVLAASCATDQRSGFLLPRVRRHTVALNSKSGGGSDSGTIYVCSMIEDFRGHVLQGALHKRGWVLQEHALARRTVFFTEHQTYWECGYGVRCETMVRMTNESAALLGDPEFPRILDPAKHGERILRFQELYQQYSRLNLSSDYDRPTAIDGLQRRLLRTMGVNGGFGVLDNTGNRGLLRRSLLWRRGEGIKTLTPITFPSHRERVPSWSWMSVSGGIDYFPPTWRGYDWQDIQSPWSYSTLPKIDNAFIGRSQPFECSKWKQNEYSIVFDDPTIGELPELMAIVLGVEKSNQTTEEKKHYVLIARPKVTSVQDSVILYERVGAGYMPGKCLEGVSKTCILV